MFSVIKVRIIVIFVVFFFLIYIFIKLSNYLKSYYILHVYLSKTVIFVHFGWLFTYNIGMFYCCIEMFPDDVWNKKQIPEASVKDLVFGIPQFGSCLLKILRHRSNHCHKVHWIFQLVCLDDFHQISQLILGCLILIFLQRRHLIFKT